MTGTINRNVDIEVMQINPQDSVEKKKGKENRELYQQQTKKEDGVS